MPPYRLQTLLEIRERSKKEAEDAFSASVKALDKEKVELRRLQEDLDNRRATRKAKINAFFEEVMAKGAGVNGLNMVNRYEQRLKDEELQVELEIEKQKESVKVAERLVEQRRREMAEAAKDLKAIEKHKDKWKKQLRAEQAQKEELVQEEIGNTLFLMRQRKKPAPLRGTHAMSRVEEDRDAQRAAERLLQQRQREETKARKAREGDSAFSRLMQQAKGQEQGAQQQQKLRTSHENPQGMARQALARVQHEVGSKRSGEQAETGRQVQRRQGAAQEQQVSEARQQATGHVADDGEMAQLVDSRKADARTTRETQEERGESSLKGGSDLGAHASRGKGELKSEADGGKGSGEGGEGKKEGGGEPAPSFRFNPALMAPVPVAQARPASSAERLRKMASQIAEKIVERVRVGTNHAGVAEFQIDLRNDVLSGLSIKLSAKNGRIQATFSGRDPEVLKMLEQQGEELKKALSGRGLTLEQLRFEARK